MKILIVAALACASLAQAEDIAKKTFSGDGLSALDIATGAGDIEVAAGGAEISVQTLRFDPKLCVLTMAPKAGTLILKAEKKIKGPFGGGCRAGFKVTAPAALRVSADVGAGSIKLDGLKGTIRVHTGAGSIKGTVASREVDLATGAGSIDLAWKSNPAEGRIKADTGAGSIRLAFPEGTKLTADLKTGVGSVRNQLGDTKDAELRVIATSGVGSVTLAELEKKPAS